MKKFYNLEPGQINIFLTLCMLSHFSCFCCCLLTFFQNKRFFQEQNQSVKQFGSRSGHFVSPDLGPKSLQRLSVDNKSRR